jgi:hypothetical protein
MSEAVVTYCENHPTRETSLRCNRCGKYICSRCAVRTPTGYRCQECVRGQQKVFNTARPLDYLLGFGVALLLSYIGALIAVRIGFFTILLAPAAGSVIAEGVRIVVGRRRSTRLFQLAAAAVVLGAAPFVLLPLFFMFAGGGFGELFSLLWPALYVIMATPTVYYRLSGLQLGR